MFCCNALRDSSPLYFVHFLVVLLAVFHNNQHHFSSSSNLFCTLFLSFVSRNGIHTIQDFVLGFGFFNFGLYFYHLRLLFVVSMFLVYNKISCLPFIICDFYFVTIYILFALELPMVIKINYVLFTICIALLIDVLQEMIFFAANATSLSPFKPNVIPLVEHQSKLIFTLATLHEL